MAKPRSTARLSPDLDAESVGRAYARWAPVYDALCGPLLRSGRRAGIAAVAPGSRILEIGIGTGISLAEHDPRSDITGIDINSAMLAKAQRRLASGILPHVRGLALMDAHRLGFADASFDAVIAQFVITLVSQPETVLSECARVVRPGGQIVVVSHLYSEHGPAASVERLLARPARSLGLRPEFPFVRLAAWARAHGAVELVARRSVPPFGLYTVVEFRRRKPEGDPARISQPSPEPAIDMGAGASPRA